MKQFEWLSRMATVAALSAVAVGCDELDPDATPGPDGGGGSFDGGAPFTPTYDGGPSLPGDSGTIGPDSGTQIPGAARGLPCNVQAVVDKHCASCHSDPPKGTFMALLTQAHFQAQGTTDPGKKYFELAKERVTNTANPMPPRSEDPLSADELTTLTAWLDQGAPASTAACANTTPDGGVAPPDDVDTSGLECYRFLAHAQGDKTKKFKVGAARDAYWNFGFKAPWTGMLYGMVVRPVIDNAKVLHHWLIYKESIGDGEIEKTIGQHTNGELVHGWAPGGTPMDFRKHGDVAFELPDSTYAVEVHYNSADADAEDASGVELCGVKTAPKNIASMTWLGYDQGGAASYATGGGFCLDAATQWTGTCVPQSQEPIHLVYMVPHLHQTGRHLKATINKPFAASRVLLDQPFDFNTQIGYETNEVLMPGETITTVCNFSEPKCAGQGTNQEMCYLFTYAYPKYALSDNGAGGTFMHGKGACLGQ